MPNTPFNALVAAVETAVRESAGEKVLMIFVDEQEASLQAFAASS